MTPIRLSQSVLTLALLALAAAACGPEAPYDLEIRGKALTIGRSLHVGVAEADGDVLIANEWFPVNDDTLHVVYGSLLAETVAYRMDLYLDVDDDGACDAPPTDRAWRTEVGPVQGTVVVDLGGLEQDASACDFFSAER